MYFIYRKHEREALQRKKKNHEREATDVAMGPNRDGAHTWNGAHHFLQLASAKSAMQDAASWNFIGCLLSTEDCPLSISQQVKATLCNILKPDTEDEHGIDSGNLTKPSTFGHGDAL